MGFTASAPMRNKVGAFECRQMLGDHGLRDSGGSSQSVHGLIAVAGEALKDGAPRGIGEGLEDGAGGVAHAKTITKRLLIVNGKYSPIMESRRMGEGLQVTYGRRRSARLDRAGGDR